MRRTSLKVMAALLVLVVAQGCMVRATDYEEVKNQLATTQASIDGYQNQLAAKNAEVATLSAENEQLKSQLDEKSEKINALEASPAGDATLAAIYERLEAVAKGRKDMQWDSVGRKLLVSVEFDLGSAAVKPTGKSSIKDIAGVLKTLPPEYVAYIDGHTDDQPVKRPETVAKYTDNPGLAAARALAVYRVLREGGVPPKSMIIRGFGPYYPVVANVDEDGRSKNRRVEISVVPSKLALAPVKESQSGSDVVEK